MPKMATRLSLFPIRDDEKSCWAFYQAQEQASWAVSEVNLTDDIVSWQHLSQDLRDVLEELMAFFAVSDRLITLNLESLQDRIDPNDMVRSMMLASQERIEGVHMHMYGLFIQSIVPDELRRRELFDAVQTYPAIAKKTKWMQQWLHSDDKRVLIVANACGEGIGFSDAFGVALFPKTLGEMYGWCYGNEKVMGDEFIHFSMFCDWYKSMEPLEHEIFESIVRGAVEVEEQFVHDLLDGKKLVGLSADQLVTYSQYIADLLCEMCGHPTIFGVNENPLDYMDLTALKGKTNFFERTVAEYGKASLDEGPLELDFGKRV